MQHLLLWLSSLVARDSEEGQGMTEYGLIIALVVLVVFAALWLLGPTVANFYVTASNSLS